MNHYSSIKELVIDCYNAEGKMPSYTKLTALVRKHFPNSKWKETHYAWYKSAFNTGKISTGTDADNIQERENDIEETLNDSLESRVSLERDLHNYVANKLDAIETGLKLHDRGIEYKTEIGRIDILAIDNADGFVVIELKAGKANDRDIGQILGYMGCMSGKKDNVRGVLVAANFDDRVIFAAKSLPNIRLIKYKLNFDFDEVR